MSLHKISVLPPKERLKRIEDIPSDKLHIWAIRLFALMNLAWDYVDTICTLCITNQIGGTKKLVREVRNIKREYDRFRWQSIDARFEVEEADNGERFEDLFAKDFAGMTKAISTETDTPILTGDEGMLYIAVQQALVLMEAVKIYARWCDKQIAGYGVWVCDCCMIQTEFLKLYPLIPQFNPDPAKRGFGARKRFAQNIANRLHIFGAAKNTIHHNT